MVIRGRSARGTAGFWFRVREYRWGFYRPGRRSTGSDIRRIASTVRGVRDLSTLNDPGPNELLFHVRPRAALALMARGPGFAQAKPSRKRPVTGANQALPDCRTPDLHPAGPGTPPEGPIGPEAPGKREDLSDSSESGARSS